MSREHRSRAVLLATYPFGACGREPLEMIEKTGWDVRQNPYARRLRKAEVAELIRDVDGVLAGTEPYTRDVLPASGPLKVIARVGIGLESVDLEACQDLGITVTYTPDAPSQGVAELTVANIVSLLRHVRQSDKSVRERTWTRHLGVLVSEVTIGVLGVGRIGRRVVRLLQPFGARILANDIEPDHILDGKLDFEWTDAKSLFRQSDVLTVHIPGGGLNRHFVNRERLGLMRTGAYLVNTSRGSVVDESALVDAIVQGHLDGAALDVFENEPYEGPLAGFDNVILTAHIGASARASRFRMELEAAEDCVRVLSGLEPLRPAPRPS